MEKESKIYLVRCPLCGPKGKALVQGHPSKLPDYFVQIINGCWCEFTAIEKLQEPEPPKKKSKAMQRNIDMLERCLAITPPQDFMFGEPYGDE